MIFSGQFDEKPGLLSVAQSTETFKIMPLYKQRPNVMIRKPLSPLPPLRYMLYLSGRLYYVGIAI